jgi:hypothetical protein
MFFCRHQVWSTILAASDWPISQQAGSKSAALEYFTVNNLRSKTNEAGRRSVILPGGRRAGGRKSDNSLLRILTLPVSGRARACVSIDI